VAAVHAVAAAAAVVACRGPSVATEARREQGDGAGMRKPRRGRNVARPSTPGLAGPALSASRRPGSGPRQAATSEAGPRSF
jgi:hypothetical protein